MEKRKILVRCEGDKVYIGDMPQLVVNLKTQDNYIIYQGGTLPYHREIALSDDLLAGKRKNVFDTAIRHYYTQACQVVQGKEFADLYRNKKVNEL